MSIYYQTVLYHDFDKPKNYTKMLNYGVLSYNFFLINSSLFTTKHNLQY